VKNFKITARLAFRGAKPAGPERYGHGIFLTHPDLASNESLKKYIREERFLDVPEENRVKNRNRQHKVYSFHLAELNREVVMKVYWMDPTYPLWRRIEIWISLIFQDRCYRAFIAALSMQKHDIPTYTPLAYWTHRKKGHALAKYLLCERIPAAMDMTELIRRSDAEGTDEHKQATVEIIRKWARLVAKMHRHNMIHGDIATCNFLIELPSPGSALPTPGDCDKVRLSAIDTDQVNRSLVPLPAFRKMKETWSLRGLNLNDARSRIFLKEYLGKNFREGWWRLTRYLLYAKHGKYALGYRYLTGRRTSDLKEDGANKAEIPVV
jgi:hypothetical protein